MRLPSTWGVVSAEVPLLLPTWGLNLRLFLIEVHEHVYGLLHSHTYITTPSSHRGVYVIRLLCFFYLCRMDS